MHNLNKIKVENHNNDHGSQQPGSKSNKTSAGNERENPQKNPGTRFRTNQLRLQSLIKTPTLPSQGLEAMSPKKTTRQE